MKVREAVLMRQLTRALQSAGLIGVPTRDAEGRMWDTYHGVSLADLLAAVPPPERFDTKTQILRYIRDLDEWIYRTDKGRDFRWVLPGEPLQHAQ